MVGGLAGCFALVFWVVSRFLISLLNLRVLPSLFNSILSYLF